MGLTVKQVEKLVRNGTSGATSDGNGLYLKITPVGNASWQYRYQINGNRRSMGLGSCAQITLAEARTKAADFRKQVKAGIDPLDVKEAEAKIIKTNQATFCDVAKDYIDSHRSGWRNVKHIQQWRNTLDQYAYPIIGNKLPANVDLADILAILQPIWAVKTETATRLRQRIEAVLDYAAVHDGSDRRNPARWKNHLDKILPAARKVAKRVHHAAAPYPDVPKIMSALRNKDSLSAYCLRFIILTAARSGEARGALWNEIKPEAKTWTIPASRMKAEREHRVPLCDEAMEILAKMQEWQQGSDKVFAGTRGGLLSDAAVNKTLHTIAPNVTAHGFRSSFRQWGAEATSFPSAVLELALAHVNRDQVEAAYQRSDLFERRVELMGKWGQYCINVSNVTPIRSKHA